jgi:hypothetical protein
MHVAFNILAVTGARTFAGATLGGYWLIMHNVRVALACLASVRGAIAVAQQGVSCS